MTNYTGRKSDTSRFNKILIANRGEIAVHIIRACRDLGIATVAVYSDADRTGLHVRLADEAYRIGAPPAAESYLNGERIIDAAKRSGADAVHPGYGFLSENAGFAQACIDAGLGWIGPHPEAIALMGDKGAAKRTVAAAGVPLVPGAREPLPGADAALELAGQIGYPVLLKATAGGGGRGMRVVEQASEMAEAWQAASREALAAFGDGNLYIERYLQHVRHIEFQILADKHGTVLHLGERECSVQRRHQKLIEESPSSALTPELRANMGAAAVAAARACNYDNAGTIEFLLDERDNFYFLEMNTRLQVEHPVTEAVTGIDIVIEQIHAATGRRLHLRQEDIRMQGHAIECRITAEDVMHGFLPATGRISKLVEPGGPGIRIDSSITSESTISPHYDSMIAKVIASAGTRAGAILRMRRALREMRVHSVPTSIPFHLVALQHATFTSGRYDLSFFDKAMHTLLNREPAQHNAYEEMPPEVLAAILATVTEQRASTPAPAAGKSAGTEDTTLSAWQLLTRRGES